MKETVERELKLSPGEGFVMPELGGEPLPPRTFVSTYHDTPDLVLARHGVTFRHRVEDGAGLWQLKLPKGGATRIELELAGPPARPPEEMLALVVAFLRGRPVVPVARLRTRREGFRAEGAEIVHDSVAVMVGTQIARRFGEVEIELLEGDERTLRRFEQELRRAGADSTDTLRPKLFRALDLADPPAVVEVPSGSLPSVALGIALGEQVRRLLVHDPGTRLGSDAEDLHQLRVTTRRLRAFLRAGRSLLDRAWADDLRTELGWLGRELGPARDLDVLVERLEHELAELGSDAEGGTGLLVELEAERATARRAVVEALSSEQYLALLDRLDHVHDPELSGDEPPLVDVWRSEWKKTRKAFSKLDETSADDDLHAARIRVKRARYAAELAAHELGKRGKAFVEAAKELQDVLGIHQDATVAEERIRSWAAGASDGGVAAGRLVQLERARKSDARAAWPAAWRSLHRAAKKLA
ncbi:MAG: CHAD domain-containing protein [Gaiella sp.]